MREDIGGILGVQSQYSACFVVWFWALCNV